MANGFKNRLGTTPLLPSLALQMTMCCSTTGNFAVSISGRHQYPLLELAWAYFKTDNIEEAQKIFDELLARSKTEFISGLSLGVTAYASKKYDLAFHYLEKAFEEKASLLITANVYPFFTFLKTDPRFHIFLEKMNFPE